MSPTPTDTYKKVLDISEHQGAVDFNTMRDRGVDGLIIRTNHATAVDRRCGGYVRDARLAGWRDDQLGAYTFCNPKRATAEASGKAFVDTVRGIFGHTRTVLMLDIEAYESQPGGNLPVLKGPLFAAWIRDHIASVRRHAPDATVIAYSNAAFWNIWVGDQALASELEWIVPRYPAYSVAAYQRNPLPTTPAGWVEWAWRVGPKGPVPPSGVAWHGWQFSAGFNAQGARYGCQSSDLDLNIVEASAWARWTRTDTPVPVPVPPPTDIAETEETTVRIKVQDTPGGPPDVWFERIGMDLHTVSSGHLFAKMPGAKPDESDIAVITQQEMMWEIEATRYTYGALTAAQALRLGPDFVTLWNANHEPPLPPGGPGGSVPLNIQLSGTAKP